MFSTAERPKISPWSFRDSGISATPASRLLRGLLPSLPAPIQALPCSMRFAPKIARASSVRPAPTRPAMPTTSPARTSNDAFATPAALRSLTVSTTERLRRGRFGGNVVVRGRPSIASTSVASVSSDVGDVRMTLPSRRTVTVSASSSTSRRKWEMSTIVSAVRRANARSRGAERLRGAERRRRLVHDDDSRVAREGPQDLGFLLLGRPQAPGAPGPKVEAAGGQLRVGPAQGPTPDEPEAPRSAPKHTFSATVSCGTSDGSWAIAATP